MDMTSVRQLFDAFGFRVSDVVLNPAIVFIVVGATYWIRRFAARALLPLGWEQFESLMDGIVCWLAPAGVAMIATWSLNGTTSWNALLMNGFLYAAVSSMAYGLFAKALMEKAWGPINGQKEAPRG